MTVFQAFILGILQGMTEFFPVSSSGHLVIAETYFNFSINPKDLIGFEVVLHAGSLLALVIVYAKEWKKIIFFDQRRFAYIVCATIPVGLAGIFFGEAPLESLHAIGPVSVMLGVTGIVLILGEYIRIRDKKDGTYRDSFIIGCIQAFALVPGLSRSGLTVSAGMILGMDRKEAVDFSFLIAVPAIAGASMLTGIHVASGNIVLPHFLVNLTGFFSSFLASLWTIAFLRQWVCEHRISIFSWYLISISIVLIALMR